LSDWSDTAHTIKRLLVTLGQPDRPDGGRYQVVGLDQVIRGKLQRTEFLVKKFRELRNDAGGKAAIFPQAAFSTFAAARNTMDRQAPDHNQRYVNRLLEEREAIAQLIESHEAQFTLIVWPVRARRVKERFENLIKWMEAMLENEQVRYACARYPWPNQYIVRG